MQRLGQIAHTRGAAGAGLVADDALHGFHVLEAPHLESMIEIDQALGEFIQIPILDGIVIDPEPGPGQALVRVHAVSLNYRDLLVADGTYPRGASKERLIPTSDGAGVVIRLGPGTQRLKPGDRVIGAFFQKWLSGPFDFDAAVSSALGTGE